MALKMNTEIRIGDLVGPFAGMLGMGAVWLIIHGVQGDTSARDITTLRTDLTTKIEMLGTDLTKRIDASATATHEQWRQVREDISNLPSVAATIVQMEKRMDQVDNRVAAQSSRLDIIQSQADRDHAKLETLVPPGISMPRVR
jgi:flagellin-like hook-associated protein FlgL